MSRARRLYKKHRHVPFAENTNVDNFYADGMVCSIFSPKEEDRRKRNFINCLKRKHNIPQNMALLIHFHEDGRMEYKPLAKDKQIKLIYAVYDQRKWEF